MQLKYILPIFFTVLFINGVKSQRTATRGKEFYFTFLFHESFGSDTIRTLLFLTAVRSTTGTVSNPNTGYSMPFSITAGTVTELEIPKSEGLNTPFNQSQNKGLYIKASDTIAAFTLNTQDYSSDAANLIQKDALGYRYLVASYDGLIANTGSNYYAAYYASFAIVATEDSTSVSIIPSVTTDANNPAGIPFNILLNRGQTYLVRAKANLAGSLVSVNDACKKIAVFSGAECNFIVSDPLTFSSCDHLYEQLFPVSSFGREFITTKLKGRNTYFGRIFAAYDSTVIAIDGMVAGTINSGQFYEFKSLNEPRYITTSKPGEVAIFATSYGYDTIWGPENKGDPTMMIIPPLEQQLTESIFLSPETGAVTLHKVNVICKTPDVFNTVLDGVNIGDSFSVVSGNPLFSFAAIEIKSGQHRVQNASGFMAYAYGFGLYQGYGYCTGSDVDKINTYFTCNGISSISSPTIDVCAGPVTFDIITFETNTSYTWDFGDGSAPVITNGSVLHQTHTYTSAGNYTVKLITSTGTGNTCETNRTDSTHLTLHIFSALIPGVSIVSSPPGSVCEGTRVSFIATPTNAGANPVYQWTLNGNSIGNNSPTLTSASLISDDVISCTVTGSLTCASSASAAASVTMQLNRVITPAISIAGNFTSVCGNAPVTFTATVNSGNQSIFYQWKVNNLNTGTNNSSFIFTPRNGDTITCEITERTCIGPLTATSNAIVIVERGPIVPSVTISTTQTTICSGVDASFTAVPVNGGTNPLYQWKINGSNTGSNSSSFNSNILKDNDIVSCVLTSSIGCITTPSAVSNEIKMKVDTLIVPLVSIAADAPVLCEGSSLNIIAAPVNGGAVPVYQWQINGNDVVNNGPVFSYNFNNSDVVSCTIISSERCAINPAFSNTLTVIVSPEVPSSVSISASHNPVCKGEQVTLTAATVNGGIAPEYKWYLNGNEINASSGNIISTEINNGDRFKCEMSSDMPCTSTAISPEIIMQVDPIPTILFNPPESVISLGSAVLLDPVITGNISTYLWEPPIYLSTVNTASTMSAPKENTVYKLTVTSVDGCKAEGSVTVTVFNTLLMPSAFSPNDDGKNDVFRIAPPGLPINLQRFAVYDRWGQKIFETNNKSTGWDGTIKGTGAGTGVYIWIISYENPLNHQMETKKGTVVLIR